MMVNGVDATISVILLLFGLYSYVFYYLKTRDFFNPFGITNIIWCVICSVSSLHLSYLQNKWEVEMYLIIFIFPIIVFLTGLNAVGKYKVINKVVEKKFRFTNAYIACSRMIFIICVICSLIEWKNYDFAILLETYEGADAKAMFSGMAGVHYGTICLPYCSLVAVFELCFREQKNRKTIIYLMFCIIYPMFYSLFVLISRGTLLIIILGSAYIINQRYNIKLKYFAIFIVLVVVGFVAFSFYRLWNGSLVFSVIPNHPILSSLYSYTGLNLENLNKLVAEGANYTITKRTLWGIWQTIGFENFLVPLEPVKTTAFFNATTICYCFYDDLGVLGVILYTLIYYSIIRVFYTKSLNDKRYILILAALQKAIWMTFFGDYFMTYRVILFPYLVVGIIMFSMKCRFTIGRVR